VLKLAAAAVAGNMTFLVIIMLLIFKCVILMEHGTEDLPDFWDKAARSHDRSRL